MNIRQAPMVVVLLISTGLAQTAVGQRRSGHTPAKSSKPAASQSSVSGPTAKSDADKYWAAQRSMEAAIQQLEAYLRQSPNGERAETARQQLAMLKSLTVTATRPEWVRMGEEYRRDVPLWRVASVAPQTDKTQVTVEITCKREDGQDCYFYPFDRKPLVMIDNSGRYYPMLEAGDLPPDIRFRDEGRRGGLQQAVISGGRTINVRVAFAPLANGVTSGQIYYREDNLARPALFFTTRK